MQSSGQWLVNVVHGEAVTADGPLKDLRDKATMLYHGASLTFSVK